MRANARRFLLAVVLAAAWLGLNVAFPDLGPTGIPAAVTRLTIHGIILVGLWLGLSRTDFTGGAAGRPLAPPAPPPQPMPAPCSRLSPRRRSPGGPCRGRRAPP